MKIIAPLIGYQIVSYIHCNLQVCFISDLLVSTRYQHWLSLAHLDWLCLILDENVVASLLSSLIKKTHISFHYNE
jgi:hypothetical protein